MINTAKIATGALVGLLLSMSIHGETATPADYTTVHYGAFSLNIPTKELAGASLLSVDGPVIKFSDSKVLGGVAATTALLELPKDFDLHSYPRLVLGLKSTASLPVALRARFDNALESFGLGTEPEIVEITHDSGMLYTACAYPSCLIFATQQDLAEHILMLYPEGFHAEEVLGFLGVTDVN